MKACYIISTVDLRRDDLMQLLKSIVKYQPHDVALCLQKYTQRDVNQIEEILKPVGCTCIVLDEYVGANIAKIQALGSVVDNYDFYINLDDDMEMTDKTNYAPIFAKLANDKSMALISGNWRKTKKQIDKIEKYADKPFVKQKIVYTGGGLVYRNDIAHIILENCTKDYLMDDVEWSVTCYVRGYDNGRYLNSFAEHRVCTKNGRATLYKGTTKVANNSLYFNFREQKKDVGYESYCIPIDGDLTDIAHEMHKQNKKRQ